MSSQKYPYQLAQGDTFVVCLGNSATVHGVRWNHKEKQYEVETTTGLKVLCPIIRKMEVLNR